MTSSTSLRIDPRASQRPLSKVQSTFNTLIARIENARLNLASWQTAIQKYEVTRANDYVPLRDKFSRQQVAFVKALDSMLNTTKLTKGERRTAGEYICELAETLLESIEDATLSEIYTKYSGVDFDAEEEEMTAALEATFEEMFGADFNEDGKRLSPEELLARFGQKMYEEPSHEYGAQQHHHERKKTAKQLAREAKAQKEADLTNLSIREVYRKLVSALHPDREPDPIERERKTALMQRVNQAYDKKDLLLLLELQLELEHIDANAIASMPDERVKHFNKILKEQLKELQQEIEKIEFSVCMQFDISPYEELSSETIQQQFSRDIAEMKKMIARSEDEMLMIRNPVSLKFWLKEMRRQMKAMRYDTDSHDIPF
jgi:hypothetical protein